MSIQRLISREEKNGTQDLSQVLTDEKADVSMLVARVTDGDIEAYGEIYSIYITQHHICKEHTVK